MIPAGNGFLREDFEITEEPTNTFYLDIDRDRIYGFTGGIDAMKQAIYLILFTERYRYIIFSRNYGVELEDLFGEPVSFVIPETKRRITEALLYDSRIENLEDFDFKVGRNTVIATFTAVTVFGNIPIERAVNF